MATSQNPSIMYRAIIRQLAANSCKLKIIFITAILPKMKQISMLYTKVDFRFRLIAFRGVGGEPPRHISACGVSPVPLIP
ncbi:hypothetical protein AN957_10795 [Cytobacillus solani]|uniref:Uncharacterized protein n=1 Tax=Cytobacillus solani TaxID=1637975 RepID=A0A0Q3VGA9_9BACI|nr:hypothetical protein AN957_10795 [Cytobacillus solani]